MKPVYSISISEYNLANKPEYEKVGGIIDAEIKKYFMGKHIATRCLSMQDHPNMTIDSLVEYIDKNGTDKYNADRKMSVAHDFYAEKGVELFVSPIFVSPQLNHMSEVVADFYEGALEDRGYAIKVDLIAIYDLEKLELIPIQYDDGIGNDAFKFKDSHSKQEAVLGFIKVL